VTTASAPQSAVASQGLGQNLRGSNLVLAASAIGAVLELGSQVMAVRYLSTPAFGAFAFALAVALFLQGVAQFGMPLAVSRFAPMLREADDDGGVMGVVAIAIGAALVLGTVLAGLVMAFALVAPPGVLSPVSADALRILALMIPLEAVIAVATSVFAVFGRTRAIIVRGALLTPGLKCAATAVVVLAGGGVTALATAYVASSAIGAVVACWLVLGILRQTGLMTGLRGPRRWPTRDVLPFAAVALSTTLVWSVLEMSDAILLGFLRGPDDVAELRAITPLMRGHTLISAAFIVFFTPLAATYLARADGRAMQELYVRTSAWLATLAFPLLLMTSAFAGVLVDALYGARYAGSSSVLLILSIGYFVQTASGFNGQTLKIHGLLRFTMAVDACAMIVNIGVNLLLIPRLGATGAAIGTTSTLLAHNTLKQLGMRRFTGIHLVDSGFLRLLGLGAALLGAVVVVGQLAAPTLPVALAITAVATAVLVRTAGDVLQIAESFPASRRLPVLRWLVPDRRLRS
jgi:O-antigen/teichoic acid export membrane protein